MVNNRRNIKWGRVHFCACLNPESRFPTPYVMIIIYVQKFDVRCDCSL